MSRRVRLEPEAEAEIGSAMEWDQRERPGLGRSSSTRSMAASKRSAPRARNAGRFPEASLEPARRRRMVKRFPYAVASLRSRTPFASSPSPMLVVALAHRRGRL